ncbi:10786_t:CDS:2 [Funneliformis geosporum]|nr:10786_t:CDS:2 [Funneliformis geosporum]
MDTEPISSVDNSPKEKGKNPEISLPHITTTILNEDQAYDASENMFKSSKDNKNVLTFERDNDTSTLYAYCAAKKFFPSKSNKEKINKACALFNGLQFLAFIGTLNVRSFTDKSKQQYFFNLFQLHDFDIVALQETNFSTPAFQKHSHVHSHKHTL